MNKPINKIKLSKDIWFTILGNKVVFGNLSTNKDLHYTFSYGNRSGIFDLHLTNKSGLHFTILTIAHEEIYKILPQLLFRFQESVMDLEVLNEKRHLDSNSIIFKIDSLGEIEDNYSILTKKKRLIIDKDSKEFEDFSNKLKEKYSYNEIHLDEVKKLKQFHGIVLSKNNAYFIIKNQYLGDNIYKFSNLDLDYNSVFEKVIGEDLYNKILDRINDGLKFLKENDNTSC